MKKEKVISKLEQFIKEQEYFIVETVDGVVRGVKLDAFIGQFMEFLNVKESWEMRIVGSSEYHTVKYENGLYSCSCGAFTFRDIRPCHHIQIAILKKLYRKGDITFTFSGKYPTVEDGYLQDLVVKDVPVSNISNFGKYDGQNSSDKFWSIFKYSSLYNEYKWINAVLCVPCADVKV